MSRHARLLLLLPILLIAAVASARDALPDTGVALVADGPGVARYGVEGLVREELTRILESEYRVVMPDDLVFTGDHSIAGVGAALDRALADPRTDLVVCLGPLGSLLACRRTDLPRPVIAAVALDAGAQDLPSRDGASGVRNLSYVLAVNTFDRDLLALRSLVPDVDTVVILGGDPVFLAVPDFDPGDSWVAERLGLTVHVRSAGRTAAEALAALPADADAVMLLPLIGYGDEEIDRLLAGLRERRLPTTTLVGEPMVRRGALVGTTGATWLRRVARRVALNARKILGGREAGELPVALEREGSLYINMDTARAIGVYPPFEVMVDAVAVDAERETGRPLDLWQAMDEAVSGNRDLAAAAAQLASGRENLAIARARLLPQVSASVIGSALDEDRAAAAMRPSERSITAGADLTQVLWSDDVWSAYTVEKRLLKQREAEYEQARLDVALDAASAYLQVLRTKTAERLRRANLRLSRQNLERARVLVQLGDANRSELYRWESKIATEKADLIRSMAARNVAEMELNRILDRPLEEPFLLAETDLDAQLSLLMDDRVSRSMRNAWDLRMLRRYLVDFSRRMSPELAQIEAGIAAQERVLGGKKRAFYLPDVSLSLGWKTYLDESGAGAGGRPDTFVDDDEWSAAVVFSLPLLEGGGRFAEKRQAGRDLLRLRAQYAAAGQRIEQRVRGAVHNTSASRAAITLSRQAADASGDNFDLVRDSYGRGGVDLITLLDAQNAHLNAQLAAADAVYIFLLDLMELERSVGRFTYFATPDHREAWLQDFAAWFDSQER